MSDKYKVIVYTDATSLEEGLNSMSDNGYNLKALTRGVSGYITAVYEKQ